MPHVISHSNKIFVFLLRIAKVSFTFPDSNSNRDTKPMDLTFKSVFNSSMIASHLIKALNLALSLITGI